MKRQTVILFLFLSALPLVLGCSSSSKSADVADQTDTQPDSAAPDSTIDTAPDTQPDSVLPDTTVDTTPDSFPDTSMDTPIDTLLDTSPDSTPDIPVDTAPQDTGQPEDTSVIEPTHMGTLTVNCNVPFILDASQVNDMLYMAMHFADLIQQYGITGVVGGLDVTSYIEKMYYGSHDPIEPIVSLTQVSMTDSLVPQISVKVDFFPDSAVTANSTWDIGLGDGQAVAMMLQHTSQTDYCLFAVGYAGQLTFGSASGTTLLEGGSFSVSGSMEMGNPTDITGFCTDMASAGLRCCN